MIHFYFVFSYCSFKLRPHNAFAPIVAPSSFIDISFTSRGSVPGGITGIYFIAGGIIDIYFIGIYFMRVSIGRHQGSCPFIGIFFIGIYFIGFS